MIDLPPRSLLVACTVVLLFCFATGHAMVSSGIGLIACGYLLSASYFRKG